MGETRRSFRQRHVKLYWKTCRRHCQGCRTRGIRGAPTRNGRRRQTSGCRQSQRDWLKGFFYFYFNQQTLKINEFSNFILWYFLLSHLNWKKKLIIIIKHIKKNCSEKPNYTKQIFLLHILLYRFMNNMEFNLIKFLNILLNCLI